MLPCSYSPHLYILASFNIPIITFSLSHRRDRCRRGYCHRQLWTSAHIWARWRTYASCHRTYSPLTRHYNRTARRLFDRCVECFIIFYGSNYCIDMTLERSLPPSVTIEVPWEALDSNREMHIRASCNPTDITTLTPEKMSVAEANYFYRHILSLQNTQDPFSFTPIYYAAEDGPALESGTFSFCHRKQKAPAGSTSGDISKNTPAGQVYGSTSESLATSTHSKGDKKGTNKRLPEDVAAVDVPPAKKHRASV